MFTSCRKRNKSDALSSDTSAYSMESAEEAYENSILNEIKSDGTTKSEKSSDISQQDTGTAINYEKTVITMNEGSAVQIAGVSRQNTGEQVEIKINCSQFSTGYLYYTVDWGDGTWCYNGPFNYR